MRKVITTLLISLIGYWASASNPSLGTIRNAFVHAAQNVDAREALISEIEVADLQNNYRNAYMGAAKTLLAESSVAPWSKWNYFQDGKELIEDAILKDPGNAEFRYLRFLIQFNAPAFLEYDENLSDDYAHVVAHISDPSNKSSWINHFDAFHTKHLEEIKSRIKSDS